MPVVPRLGRVVIYHKELSPINSNNPLVTFYYEIKSETRIIISLLPTCLWPSNLAWCWFTLKASYPWSHTITCSCEITWPITNIGSPLPQCYNYTFFQIQKSNICNFVNDNMLNYFDQDLETVIENLTQNMKIALTCSKLTLQKQIKSREVPNYDWK